MVNQLEKIILETKRNQVLCRAIPPTPKTLGRYISAFANTEGGGIYLGVQLEGKKVILTGLSTDFKMDKIIERVKGALQPQLEIEYEVMIVRGCRILRIQVPQVAQDIFFESEKYVLEDTELVKCKGVKNMDKTKVFIVHGHDNLAKEETARFITTLGLSPIILHEQANTGNTIIEKIEEYANVGFAIVLYTPCDLGKCKDQEDYAPRARQNVVFEHGYLIGRIGRRNVCALVKSQVETPGDISGMIYIDMDEKGAWKNDIIKELKKVGYDIDVNKLF